MMRLISLVIFLFFHLRLTAQNNLKGIVNYGHLESFGMAAPIGIDYNAELTFNMTQSTYTFGKNSLEGGHIRKMNVIDTNENQSFIIYKATTSEGFVYHIDRNTNLIKSRDIGFNYIKDSIPKINWKILDETKEIGDFKCFKASCNFRGRDYTAWFTLEIPLPYGPWKLQGLPGLILEAYDTDKEIYFYFKSIEYPSDKVLKIIVPNPETNMDMERNRPKKDREWISSEDFEKAMIERHKIGTKMGRIFMEQTPNVKSGNGTNPMRNYHIEVFDE